MKKPKAGSLDALAAAMLGLSSEERLRLVALLLKTPEVKNEV